MRPWAVLSLFVLAVLLGACTSSTSHPTPSGTAASSAPPATLKGVSLSPRSFQAADFNDFFDKARQAGPVVTWAGDWMEMANDKGGPAVVSQLAPSHGYTPVAIAQFFMQDTGRLLRPLDAGTRKAYVDAAAAFAEKYRPRYLGLGIEVNVLYEKSPRDFDAFVSLFGEVYDAVKSKSPATKVFTVFQLERMKGLKGGLFGGANDPAAAEWSLLNRFPEADLDAFTTYPGLVYRSPSEIPPDYYSEIGSKTSKPVAFTEVGWHSAAAPAGWESSEAEQAAFVALFFNRTGSLKPELAIWSFMYDGPRQPPFDTMGLRDASGEPKAAWNAWVGGT